MGVPQNVPLNSTFTLMVPPGVGVGKNGTNVTCQFNYNAKDYKYSALAEVLPMTN